MAGFHESMGRVYGLAVIDVVGTLGIGVVAAGVLGMPLVLAVPLTFAAGEAAHYAFKVETPVLNRVLQGLQGLQGLGVKTSMGNASNECCGGTHG
jgi:hypothetical protein